MARILGALLMVWGTLMVVAGPASAGVFFGAGPNFNNSAPVTVGDTNKFATVTIVNNSDGAEAAGDVLVSQITLIPSCGTTNPADSGCFMPGAADPGVFQLNGPFVGEAGTACAGRTFTATLIDPATGQVQFVPNAIPVDGTNIRLTPKGTPGDTCRIDFTFDVLKAPKDSQPLTRGLQTRQFVSATGTSVVTGQVGTSTGAGGITVNLLAPTITTAATPAAPATAPVGTPISDTATLSGGGGPFPGPTGTITFTAFGPANPGCAGAPIYTSAPVPVLGNGVYASPPVPPFIPPSAGTYQFIASYSGDANNAPISTACGDPGEAVVVAPVVPVITTTASAPPATLPGMVTDTATVMGGTTVPPIGGTIVFTLFGPGDPTCANPPFFTSTPVAVAGNGNYVSPPATITSGGTYLFRAAYSGDANNAAVTTPCGAAGESVVTKSAPTITTATAPTVPVGTPVHDTATIAGGTMVPPIGGSIVFRLFGPNDPTCAAAPAFTSAPVAVNGNGDYLSPNFTPQAVGTYQFVATYSGDANNQAVASPCGAPGETVTIMKTNPAIVTTASPSVPVGLAIHDTAILSNATTVPPAGGTITFTLFGPDDPTCAAPAVFTSPPVSVNGNGSYNSPDFFPTATGTYQFVAAYSGDANNNPVTSACGAANESVIVTKTNPAIVTTASPSVAVGGPVFDTATLSGATTVPPAGGTITFRLFGPNDATCALTPVFTSAPVAVNGNGAYVSPTFTPVAVGTYRYTAAYTGDANNNALTTLCNAPGESVAITPRLPLLVTNASAPVTVGGTPIHDTATLSNATVNPAAGGTITFTIFGPNDAACAGPPIFTSPPVTVTGNGNYDSANFTPSQVGLYRFIAAYSGDANNAAVTTACGDANEQVPVTPTTPAIVTNATSAAPLNSPITDTATLSMGAAPTGTIVFTLFGPNDAVCAGPPIFTSAPVVVAGNGNYTSAPFTPALAGTYRWIASYSGDANNIAVATKCNDAGEQTIVTQSVIALTTTASPFPSTNLGGPVSDTANLMGGTAPTGTITFDLFGPNNATCTGVPVFTSTVPVNGAGPYPSGPFTPTLPGIYRFQATYSGDPNNQPAGPTACNDPAEQVLVRATPALVTTTAPTVQFGAPIHDTGVLSNASTAPPAGGTITFTLFGPDDATCSAPPVFTSTPVPVAGNGSYDSPNFTPTLTGTYRFVAAYSGDANNVALTTACNAPNEAVIVNKVTPAIITNATLSAPVNGPITDTATLSGGVAPTGTITFTLFGPDNATCTGVPVFTSAPVTVSGNGNYTSAPFNPAAAGAYRWIATYSGDANNIGVSTACGDANETTTVIPVPVQITTTASPSVGVGGTIRDTANLIGGTNPTGTITFNLFGPNNATCANPPVFSSTVTVNGAGGYPSGTFTPAAPGVYRFQATYSGDANNLSVGPTACNDIAEQVVVTAKPALTTTASVTVPEGGAIFDTAHLANASTAPPAGGTITFTLFGPDNATCTGTPIATSSVNVAGNGDYQSAPFVTQLAGAAGPGTYRFIAAYSGDANNAPAGPTACGDPAEAVVVTNVPPAINIVKSATPPTKVEPGGVFTFDLVITNPSLEPVKITDLVDDVYGNLSTLGTCNTAIGTVLAPSGGSFTCSFPGTFTGLAPAAQTDVATVTGIDNEGATVTAFDDATVSLTPTLPSISVVKTASPASLPEPGGTFTFSVVVTNTSIKPITLTKLVDNVYGDLNGRGTCATGATLAANGGTYSCSFPGVFNGVGGQNQTDTVTATGVDISGNQVTATDDAIVAITSGMPSITVQKSVTPANLPEPGGTFTFTATVHNTSTEVLKLTSFVDNVYGDLNGKGTCSVPQTLAVGGSYTCTFPGDFFGTAPNTQTDMVTGTAVDTQGRQVTASDTAIVGLTPVLPTIGVVKTADPLTKPEPGGSFTFTVVVTNTGIKQVRITDLTDNVYGDLNGRGTCVTGAFLAPAATYTCSFVGTFTGLAPAAQTDVVTAKAVDNSGNTATASDDAIVRLTPVAPTIEVTKSPNPSERPAPGGPFEFTVGVKNTTFEPLTLTVLTDNVYGDLNGRGTCATGGTIAPGATYTCHFTGNFAGAAGDSQTDTVTGTGTNSRSQTATATANATVTLTPAPTLAVTKTPDPSSLPEPGGPFTFTVVVKNTTTEPLTVTKLTDDIYGDLNGKGDCRIGTVIAPGGSYTCKFVGNFTGRAGDAQTDTVTAKAVNSRGQEATATAKATVNLTPIPSIVVTKVANPTERPAPGGTFDFTVGVKNTTSEPLTLTKLVDDVYGDLNGKGTCSVPQTLAVGATYTCTFPGPFTGRGGDSQTDTVTATAKNSRGEEITATAKATVKLTPVIVPPTIAPPRPIQPPTFVPTPVVQTPLARTGFGLGGPARLAVAMILAGLLLILVTWRRVSWRPAVAVPDSVASTVTGLRRSWSDRSKARLVTQARKRPGKEPQWGGAKPSRFSRSSKRYGRGSNRRFRP